MVRLVWRWNIAAGQMQARLARRFRGRACLERQQEWLTAHNFEQPSCSSRGRGTVSLRSLRLSRICLGRWMDREAHYFRAASGLGGASAPRDACVRINRARRRVRANNRGRDALRDPRVPLQDAPTRACRCGCIRWYLDVSRSRLLRKALLRVFALASVSTRAGIYLARSDGAFSSRLTQTRALAIGLECTLEFMQADARGTRCEMFTIAHPLTSYVF